MEPGSPAAQAGVVAGDLIWKIDGEPLSDVIDMYVLLAEDEPHLFDVERGNTALAIEIDSVGRELGIDVEQPVFGPIRTCDNKCMFCFIDQMPEGLRDTLYVKDDDYRLSFLGGNFITCTNLRKPDIERIEDLRLSPLYVSLHATEPQVRKVMFGDSRPERGIVNLKTLLSFPWMEAHLQIVLVRGVNDCEHLDATLETIGEEFEGVLSVGVVPVGITQNGRHSIPEEYGYEGASASSVIEQLEAWRPAFGNAGPFAADEFFYLSGEKLPDAAYYRGYPQAENGIGLARMFVESEREISSWESCIEGTSIATTPMGAWVLGQAGLGETGPDVVVCRNSLFGPRVNVCGLLPGRDIAAALGEGPRYDRVLVPDVSLDAQQRFIDDVTVSELSETAGVRVEPVECDAVSLSLAIAREVSR